MRGACSRGSLLALQAVEGGIPWQLPTKWLVGELEKLQLRY